MPVDKYAGTSFAIAGMVSGGERLPDENRSGTHNPPVGSMESSKPDWLTSNQVAKYTDGAKDMIAKRRSPQ